MRSFSLGVVLLALVALVRGDDAKKPEAVSYQIPFRLTETKHVLVRARINGKGPYNFIVDTGAPALFVSTKVCKKLGIEPDKGGWGAFEQFEIEGGPVEKIQGRIADPFQLEGMNQLGLAGAELHGIIGYNLLARFRIELDFTRDKMKWTRLKFEPPPPEGIGDKAAGGMDAMAGLAKVMALLMGKKALRETKERGFVGVEIVEKEGGVVLSAVLKDSPAEQSGLKPGDRLTQIGEQAIKTEADMRKATISLAEGDKLMLKIARDGKDHEITVTAGKGL